MDAFSVSALPVRNQVTEWVNIYQNLNDSVQGEFMGWFLNPAKMEGYGDQVTLVIKRDTDSKVVAVSVKDKCFVDKQSGKKVYFVQDRCRQCLPGDVVGVRYDEDRKGKAGQNDAKIANIYNAALEERAKTGAVKITAAEVVDEEPSAEVAF